MGVAATLLVARREVRRAGPSRPRPAGPRAHLLHLRLQRRRVAGGGEVHGPSPSTSTGFAPHLQGELVLPAAVSGTLSASAGRHHGPQRRGRGERQHRCGNLPHGIALPALPGHAARHRPAVLLLCSMPTTGGPRLPPPSLWQVDGLLFSGCTFTNARSTETNSHERGYGIYSLDAHYEVREKCNVLVQAGQECPAGSYSPSTLRQRAPPWWPRRPANGAGCTPSGTRRSERHHASGDGSDELRPDFYWFDYHAAYFLQRATA